MCFHVLVRPVHTGLTSMFITEGTIGTRRVMNYGVDVVNIPRLPEVPGRFHDEYQSYVNADRQLRVNRRKDNYLSIVASGTSTRRDP